MTKYWVEWGMYVVYIYKSFIFNLFLTCLLLLTWLLLFMCFLGICVGGSTRAILKIARAWVQFFRKRAKKCWKRTIYLKIEQKWTKLENILKKGRWLHAIIAHKKLLEWVVIEELYMSSKTTLTCLRAKCGETVSLEIFY